MLRLSPNLFRSNFFYKIKSTYFFLTRFAKVICCLYAHVFVKNLLVSMSLIWLMMIRHGFRPYFLGFSTSMYLSAIRSWYFVVIGATNKSQFQRLFCKIRQTLLWEPSLLISLPKLTHSRYRQNSPTSHLLDVSANSIFFFCSFRTSKSSGVFCIC